MYFPSDLETFEKDSLHDKLPEGRGRLQPCLALESAFSLWPSGIGIGSWLTLSRVARDLLKYNSSEQELFRSL
ncbi:hypothetical protein TNCV_91601 [Trichonephila clavipes]|nr:hypothetical protein TNCV_91601 [Trichonephila clavipes]